MGTLCFGMEYLMRQTIISWIHELKLKHGFADPKKIAQKEKLRVWTIEDGCNNWDARLVKKDCSYLILVNRVKPRVRRNYAIAHELIHWLIKRHMPDSLPQGDQLERLCDVGAHELLFGEESL